MNIKLLNLLMCVFLSYYTIAQPNELEENQHLKKNNGAVFSNVTDTKGNRYAVVSFNSNIDFEQGINLHYFYSQLCDNVYVTKTDNYGKSVWIKQLAGTNDNQNPPIIAIDDNSNIYITAVLKDNFDLSLKADTIKEQCSSFITKLDIMGNSLWTKCLGGSSISNVIPQSISVDSKNRIRMTGLFYGTIDFNPNDGTNNLISSGKSDVFVCMLDSSGNYVWAESIEKAMVNPDITSLKELNTPGAETESKTVDTKQMVGGSQ